MLKQRRFQIIASVITVGALLFTILFIFFFQPALLAAQSGNEQPSQQAPVTTGNTPTSPGQPGSGQTPTATIVIVINEQGTPVPQIPGGSQSTPPGGSGSGQPQPTPTTGGITPTPTPTPTSSGSGPNMPAENDGSWTVYPLNSSAENFKYCFKYTEPHPDYWSYHCRYRLTHLNGPAGYDNYSSTNFSPVWPNGGSQGYLAKGSYIDLEFYAPKSSCPMVDHEFTLNVNANWDTDDFTKVYRITVKFSCPTWV